jgi:hypothetical protein
MNDTVTTKLHKPVAVYGSESWAMNGLDMNRLATWERKILRTIHGLVVEQGIWRIRSAQELRVLYEDLDTERDVKKKRMELIGPVVRIDQGRTAKKIIESEQYGSRRRRRPRFRWLEDVEKDPLEIRIRNGDGKQSIVKNGRP